MLALSVVGGRPNLVKTEPVNLGLRKAGITHFIVDAGVYLKPYGPETFNDLGLPPPSVIFDFDAGQWDYLEIVKRLTLKYVEIFSALKPNVILVYGDINPGVAATLAALRLGIPVAHVEAGLRNYDIQDTEEINRLIIDRFSKKLFATSNLARANLLNEKIASENIHVVGNTLIDALRRHLPLARYSILSELGLRNAKYGLVTIHREENLFLKERLQEILEAVHQIQERVPLIFVRYYSTLRALSEHGIDEFPSTLSHVKLISTLPYHDYLGVLQNATFVLTDSSGIQDETTYLGIPCLTCRDTTHRPETIQMGTNRLVGANTSSIVGAVTEILEGEPLRSKRYPQEWDLSVGDNIACAIKE
jgi:UDP-N-acetylglucosamine 2-epimerase (non-hydrolysing)